MLMPAMAHAQRKRTVKKPKKEEVVEDPRLKGAACILETEAGVADASVETQLAAIEKSLKRHLSAK